MPVDEYKALTHVNLPFIGDDGNGKRYEPGKMIPREDFEAYADASAATVDDRSDKDENASPLHDADSIIAYFMEWGTISDDPDAPLHPSAIIPDPNKLSLATLVAQAEILVAELEEAGEPVPKKLRDMAEISEKQIAQVTEAVGAGDGGTGVDQHA